jgi:hypothetical protein
MERSSRSEAVTAMVTAIWVGVGMVIITVGIEAEAIITAGGIIIATDCGSATADDYSALRCFAPRTVASASSSSTMRCHSALTMSFMTSASCQRSDSSAPSGPVMA